MKARILPGGYVLVNAGMMMCTFPAKGKDAADRRRHADMTLKHWFGAARVGQWQNDRAEFKRAHKPELTVIRRAS